MTASVSHIRAVFSKQCKDIFKNNQVLILFIVYPVIAAVMTGMAGEETGMSDFFIAMFAVMHVIFTPLVATAAIISEEKEKNTLRVLIMSGIRPVEYLISVGGFVFLCTMLVSVSFCFMGGYNTKESMAVMLCLAAGSLCSIVLGLAIGGYAQNMMSANSITVPFGLVLALLPMLSYFNDTIYKFSKYTYGQQISNFLQNIAEYNVSLENIFTILGNFLLSMIAFIVIFRHNYTDK